MFDVYNEVLEKKSFLVRIAQLNFSDAFKEFLSFVEVKPEDVEVNLGISKRTIERYIYGENLPLKTYLMRILLVYSPSYEISETLLFKAGYSLLGNSWADVANRTFLEQEGAISIQECNLIIDELNQSIDNSDEKIPKL